MIEAPGAFDRDFRQNRQDGLRQILEIGQLDLAETTMSHRVSAVH